MSSERFPRRKLQKILKVASALRNRPSFETVRTLLKELFVQILRYDEQSFPFSGRVDFPDSAWAEETWSIADAGGIRICAIRRKKLSFRPEKFRKLFRLYPETVAFVYSEADSRVRILLRPRDGRQTYEYRSLLPRCGSGPTSDTTATWALRLGLLKPELDAGDRSNYSRFVSILNESPAKLLERCDPFSWENRSNWIETLDIAPWWKSNDPIETFLQNTSDTRHARGLHEAFMRSFPMYIDGDWQKRLNYRDYEIVSDSDDSHEKEGEYKIRLTLDLVVEYQHERQLEETIEVDLQFPRMDAAGGLWTKTGTWFFERTTGGDLRWDSDNETPEIDDITDREETDSEEAPPELESDIEPNQGELFDELIKSEFTPETSGDEHEFFRLETALLYGVTHSLSALQYTLWHRDIDEGVSLEEYVTRQIRGWSARDKEDRPYALLPRYFFHDYFEREGDEGLLLSEFGRYMKSRAIHDTERHNHREWVCETADELFDDARIPVAETLPHPIRKDFCLSDNSPGYSPPVDDLLADMSQTRVPSALRAKTLKNSIPVDTLVVIPGKHQRVIFNRRTVDFHEQLQVRRRFSRRLHAGEPLGAAPFSRDYNASQLDDPESGPKIPPDNRLTEHTGFVKSGVRLDIGAPIVGRQTPPSDDTVSSSELLANEVLFGKREALPPRGRRDQSWYASPWQTGIVDDVTFDRQRIHSVGTVQLTTGRPLTMEPGIAVVSELGLGGIVSELREPSELPWLPNGENVDAVIVVNRQVWQSIPRDSSSCFGKNGSSLEDAIVYREASFSATNLPALRATDGDRRPRLTSLPLQSEESDSFSLHVLMAQLDGMGAREAVRELLYALDPELGWCEELESTKFEQEINQFLHACGLETVRTQNGTQLNPERPEPGTAQHIDQPAETVDYRSRLPKDNGLCDPDLFENLPYGVLESGGLQWGVTDQSEVKPSSTRFISQKPFSVSLVNVEKFGRGLAYIPVTEPVINPLFEEKIANFLGLTTDDFLAVSLGANGFDYEVQDGALTSCRLTDEVLNMDPSTVSDELTGAAAIRKALEELAPHDSTARNLLDAIWDAIPVVPPKWRPIVDGGGLSHWLSSDLNRLYVRLGNAVERHRKILDEGGRDVPLLRHLGLATLRQRLRELYGLADEKPTLSNKRRRFIDEVANKPLDGIEALLSRVCKTRLGLRDVHHFPKSIRGDWSIDPNLEPRTVAVPTSYALISLRNRVANTDVEQGAADTLFQAYSNAHTEADSAVEALQQTVEQGVVGYLFAESGVLHPVSIELTDRSRTIQLSPDIVSKSELADDEKVALYSPNSTRAQDEARQFIEEGTIRNRSGITSRMSMEVVARWGHFTFDTAPPTAAPSPEIDVPENSDMRFRPGDASRFSASALGASTDGSSVPSRTAGPMADYPRMPGSGRNVGTWLARILSGWPSEAQREFIALLRRDELETWEDALQFLEDRVQALDTRPLEFALALPEQSETNSALPLWQLMMGDISQMAAVNTVSASDFLSSIVLRRYESDGDSWSGARLDVTESEQTLEEISNSAETNGASDFPKPVDKPDVSSPTGSKASDQAPNSNSPTTDAQPDDTEPSAGVMSGSVVEVFNSALQSASGTGETAPTDTAADGGQPTETPQEASHEDTPETEASEDVDIDAATLTVRRNGDIGIEFSIDEPVVLIGAGRDTDGSELDIDLASQDLYQCIAERHCRICWEDGDWFVEDLGSQHDTRHNRSDPLPPDDARRLEEGDELIVGKLHLRFELAEVN
jgi:hypothetical protein